MIKTKNKVITVVVLLIALVIMTGFQGFNNAKGVTSPSIVSFAEVENQNIGGVISKMPDNSAKIFFQTLLGENVASYKSYDGVYETLAALRSNEIQLAWFSDVTARYLLKTQEGLRELTTPDPSESRLDFAFAVKQGNNSLRERLNGALATVKEDGTLDQLIKTYVDTNNYDQSFYEKDMTIKKAGIKESLNGTLYVGVTGAVPPLDSLDLDNQPYGFSVALMDKIGQQLGCDIKFVAMENDTAFSNLMSGKVDLLFCYGTSKNTVDQEKKRSYIMSEGYYTMDKYAYLVLE
ncbi:transporter substrate-binding domain-containing protein [Clostridium sp. Marseille-P299]|uniref:transporter substrate-binding domain-containing protein n=1 Tax=Clostridium sp. Marseille-P299 TaxID=1805477 RepID=UPI000830346E|nr:transporter substrate-binding domain-containing protein [Clostridium sp. Marseille-P299]